MRVRGWLVGAWVVVTAACAQAPIEHYEPTIGQEGKDAIWVPTPPDLVELMLDMAEVGPDDLVVDLGSGDGRNVIAAAKRGARGIGVEYNEDLVAYSRRIAREQGVSHLARFVREDMYAADVSEATVLALFLLPSHMEKMIPQFLSMRPGSRIVVNTFAIPGWEPDEMRDLPGECASWCTALLWIVPANVEGRWAIEGGGELTLTQTFQQVSGTLISDGTSREVTGSLRGAQLRCRADGEAYTAQVSGDRMEGTITRAARDVPFVASRVGR